MRARLNYICQQILKQINLQIFKPTENLELIYGKMTLKVSGSMKVIKKEAEIIKSSYFRMSIVFDTSKKITSFFFSLQFHTQSSLILTQACAMCLKGLCQWCVSDCQRLRRRQASAKRGSHWQEQQAEPGRLGAPSQGKWLSSSSFSSRGQAQFWSFYIKYGYVFCVCACVFCVCVCMCVCMFIHLHVGFSGPLGSWRVFKVLLTQRWTSQ